MPLTQTPTSVMMHGAASGAVHAGKAAGWSVILHIGAGLTTVGAILFSMSVYETVAAVHTDPGLLRAAALFAGSLMTAGGGMLIAYMHHHREKRRVRKEARNRARVARRKAEGTESDSESDLEQQRTTRRAVL